MYSNKCTGSSIVLYRPRDRGGINRSNKPGWKIETSIRIATLFVSGERGGIRRRLMMQSATKRGEKGERGGGSLHEISGGRAGGVLYATRVISRSPTNLIPCPATRYTRWSASVNCRCWNFPEIPPSSWFRNGFVVEWTKKLRKKNGVRFLESERRRQSFECDEIFDFCAREGNIAEFKWECRWKCGVAYLKADVFSLETISKLIQSF